MKYRVGMKVDRDDLHHLRFNYRVRVVWDRKNPWNPWLGRAGIKVRRREERK